MFNHFFVNTRASIEAIHKQLTLLRNVLSFFAQALFIGYYIYLIVINVNHVAFLVTYICLLFLSLLALFVSVLFVFNKGQTRYEKRLNKEKRRIINYVLILIRVALKVAVITISGIQLAISTPSDMQIITFTLSIVVLIFYIGFYLIIYIINKDIDILRLSIESDINSSKILSKLMGSEKEYTEQETSIITSIKERAKGFLNRKK